MLMLLCAKRKPKLKTEARMAHYVPYLTRAIEDRCQRILDGSLKSGRPLELDSLARTAKYKH